MRKKEAIWYLKVLRQDYSIFQKEIRDAIDYAIDKIERGK